MLLVRLARVAPSDANAALMPTLYPSQGALTTAFNRNLWRRGIVLEDDAAATTAEWVVLSYRTAYWSPGWRERLKKGGGRLVAVRSRQGVTLSELWHFPPTKNRSVR